MNLNQTLSPKVAAAAVIGFIITALTTAVAALSPSVFDSLGVWGPVLFTTLTTASMAVGAWWKGDPLRLKGAEAVAQELHVPVAGPEAVTRPTPPVGPAPTTLDLTLPSDRE